MRKLRPELTALPARMCLLPVDARGYPIPAFVETLPDGTRDFRIMSQSHWRRCVKERRCWVCDQKLGAYLAFLIGPMCAVTRTTSEPPCHRECAEWSARNCPFLARPQMHRREDEFTDGLEGNAAGCPIRRNPGVAVVWVARDYEVWRDERGSPLITVGEPVEVTWWAEGRPATRAAIEESIRTGMPLLEAQATEPGAGEELARRRAGVEVLLPGV
jgi:hypothetical protein